MPSLREGYKRTAVPTKSGSKQSRVLMTAQQRKQNRSDRFANGRNISDSDKRTEVKKQTTSAVTGEENVPKLPKKKNMVESLQKWREEKQKLKEMQAKNKRPGFKVSARVETKSASDIFNTTKKSTALKNVPSKIVAKRESASHNKLLTNIPNKFRFRRNDENKIISAEHEGQFNFGATQENQTETWTTSSMKKDNKKTKPSVGFKTPSMTTTPASAHRKFPVTPKPLSKSGQKASASRSSVKAPKKQYLTDRTLTPSPPKIVIQPTPEPEETAKVEDKIEEAVEGELSTAYFHQILDSEIATLEQLCVEWEQEMSEMSEVTNIAEENILQATGMARLIIREKFAQFRGLIENCDNPEDPKTRTLLTDLQGFWDMIKIQSDNIQGKFAALHKLKQNGWKEEVVVVKKAAPKKIKKQVAAKPATKSRLTQFLAQKKAEKMAQMTMKTPDTKQKGLTPKSAKSGNKSFSSGSKTKKCSPNVNALLAVSQIAKPAERKSLDRSVNKSLNESVPDKSTTDLKPDKPRTETPSRSILKKPELTPGFHKDRKCVLFDMITEEPEEEVFELPPVMRTYSSQKSVVSPPKDAFDVLLTSVTSSTPVAKSSLPPASGEARKRRSYAKSPHPSRRSSRLSERTIENQDALNEEPCHKTKSSPESSITSRDDSFVSKRRSSRKRTIIEGDAAASDLMTFESPATAVPVKKRRSSRAKKTLLDLSL